MKRNILTLILLIVATAVAFADNISFTATAPKSVVVGQQFRFTYQINSTDITEPNIPNIDNIDVLAGPYSSTQQSYQNYNGKVSSSVQITYTYVLVAREEGEYTIPGTTITVGGKRVTSNSVKIKALPGDDATASNSQAASNRQSGRNSYTTGRTQQPAERVSNDDLFVLATLNKTKVYEQEAVLLTYKVYTRVNLQNIDNPMPELGDFVAQEIELSQNRSFEIERYRDRNYNTIVWRQFVLFPQKNGTIEIPALNYEATVAVQNNSSMDPFSMMLNGGPSYVEVKRNIRSNALSLQVDRLPEGKPANFSNGVGTFSISSEINKNEFKTNEEFTLKIVVKGTGNMKLMKNPTIVFPDEFEVFDPVINNNFSLKNNGYTGEKVYEYVITPRSSGTFTIPAAKLVYFNTSTGRYTTIESDSYNIVVEKGKDSNVVAGTYVAREESKELATDIRHIKTGEKSTDNKNIFFATSTYLLLYIIPLMLFVLYIVIYRRKMAENANTALVRNKKASSVAVKRLKTAKRLMKENNAAGFYDEILKGLWGYMSDKLSIPVSELSKDNISAVLDAKKVDSTIVAELHNVLKECEFARYAPGDPAATMDKIYTQAIEVISKMDNSIKK